jgi:hypothetical protein
VSQSRQDPLHGEFFMVMLESNPAQATMPLPGFKDDAMDIETILELNGLSTAI